MNQPTVWKPETYLAFAAQRARPVDDLLPLLAPAAEGALYDLGCGPGNITLKLEARWPTREIIAIDSSAEMLARAQKKHPDTGIHWQHNDIAHWRAEKPAALIFANASLHWVPDHTALFPRLFGSLQPGGMLAVQMPLGQDAPYHTHIDALAALPEWRDKLSGAHLQTPLLSPRAYYDLLSPTAQSVDIWETAYHHVLDGEDPVAAWAAGTALIPYTSLLSPSDADAFRAAYAARLRAAYPPQPDGRTLFCMRRLFIVAKRGT